MPHWQLFILKMRRRRICRFAGSRKGLLFLLATLPAFYACWWLSEEVSQALALPPPPDQTLHHFRANRSLTYYFDNINLLIEPSSTCEGQQVPIVILVTSAPSHWKHRDVIRNTWGKFQKTYFFIGLSSHDDQLADTYIEAKEHSDLVVHELQDHYQNLTLKVALMLQWTQHRCSQAEFVFKTDDDVLVNPWMLREVLKDNRDAALFGYKKENSAPHREEYSKWFLPRWLYNEDLIPEYLSGTGYIINGQYLEEILSTSIHVPLINMEDVYFTYLVARRTLGLTLTHDPRLSPYKPWTGFSCHYRGLASMHSLTPEEAERAWPTIEGVKGRSSCSVFS